MRKIFNDFFSASYEFSIYAEEYAMLSVCMSVCLSVRVSVTTSGFLVPLFPMPTVTKLHTGTRVV